jgi:hypothetical protein
MNYRSTFFNSRNCLALGMGMFSLLHITQVNAQVKATDDITKFFAADGVTITKALYPRAETARQMLDTQSLVGVNRFGHLSQLVPTAMQPVVRMNRDAYYSKVVVDVSKGATITLPELPEGSYMSMQPVTEDHRPQPMSYGGGTYELATHTGDHMVVVIRLDSNFSPEQAKKYQQQMSINAGSSERFTALPVEPESFSKVERELKGDVMKLIKKKGTIALSTSLFSSPTDESRGLYSPEINQVAAAVGWGGALAKDNIYETSPNFPAKGCYQLTFDDPKNKHFWSITVYNKEGFMFNDVANVNSYKAKPNADGSYTVSMGCGADSPNLIPISNDSGEFNFTARHYGPSDRVLKEGYRLVPLIKKVK